MCVGGGDMGACVSVCMFFFFFQGRVMNWHRESQFMQKQLFMLRQVCWNLDMDVYTNIEFL